MLMAVLSLISPISFFDILLMYAGTGWCAMLGMGVQSNLEFLSVKAVLLTLF